MGVIGSRSRDSAPSGPTRTSARRPTWLRRVANPVVAILVLAGIFELLAGEPVAHATALFVVAAALLWDSIRRRHALPVGAELGRGRGGLPEVGAGSTAAARTGPPVGWSTFLLFAVPYAILFGTFGLTTWPITLAVAVPGIAVLVWSWRTQPREVVADPLPRSGVAAWIALFVGLALWELTNLLLQPSLTVNSYAHPTISVLLTPVFTNRVGRTVGLASWLGFGWYLMGR